MPTYEYRREDGTTFDLQQRITEDALTTCPTTGQPVRRVISGKAGLLFKGDGFYLTDYTSYGKEAGATGDAAKGNDAKASAGETASADAKPAAAPAPKAETSGSKTSSSDTGSASKGGGASDAA